MKDNTANVVEASLRRWKRDLDEGRWPAALPVLKPKAVSLGGGKRIRAPHMYTLAVIETLLNVLALERMTGAGK